MRLRKVAHEREKDAIAAAEAGNDDQNPDLLAPTGS
jgi:hypothetical protein